MADIVNGQTNSTNPVDQTSDTTNPTENKYDVLSITLCIVLLAPIILACVFQINFKIKKRRQDRVERQIMEVTNNPTSRRIVLDKIFEGSSKLVEFPSNKRRVQVKKYRKKTPEERSHSFDDEAIDDEAIDVTSDNEASTDNTHDVDEEMGSVEGRMIICISDKNSVEGKTTDDASVGSCVSDMHYNDGKGPTLVEDEEPSETATFTDQADDQRSETGTSPDCLWDSLDAEETSLTKLSIPDVDGSTRNALALCPKPSPNPHDESQEDEKKGEILRRSSNGSVDDDDDDPAQFIVPSFCRETETNHTSFGLVIPVISDDDEDSNDKDDDASFEDEEKPICQPSIFRHGETQSGANIEQSSSTLTEVTSNVVDIGAKADVISSLGKAHKTSSDLSIGDDYDIKLKSTIPLKNVASSKTDTSSKADTSSHISYFSFEDETIASDQADMCAICICPYDINDVQIFSKRCPHSFHKDCLFEWLVKGHDECPCCRSEMISKTEVKETSASLIGTERLAQALASTMVEAPPLRFRQARIAQMLARARQNRRRTEPDAESTESARQNTINSHWLWNARFEVMPSPERTSLPSVNEAFPRPAGLSQSTTTTPLSNSEPSIPLQTRSFDAMMNSQTADDLPAARSFDAITDPQQSSAVQSLSRHPRNLHNSWAGWNERSRTPRRSIATNTSTATAASPLRRMRRNGSDSSPQPPLAVTVLPTI